MENNYFLSNNIAQNTDKGKTFSISKRTLAYALLVIAFIFKAWLVIWQYTSNKFLVPPGGDPVHHLEKIQAILNGQQIDFSYPIFFHFLAAAIVKITHFDAMGVVIFISIFLLLIAIPIFYLFVRELFGFWPAFWATTIYTLASSFPLIAYMDGNYPEMLSYTVLAPIVFLCFLKAIKHHAVFFSAIGSIFLILIATTHHLTLATVGITIIIFLIASAIRHKLKDDKLLYKNSVIALAILAAATIIIFIVANVTYGDQLLLIFKSALKQRNPLGSMRFNIPIEYVNMYSLINPIGSIIGIIGFIYIIATSRKNGAKVLLIIWIIVLWILSRSSLSAVAPRYLRELAFPLSISAGILITYIVSVAKTRSQQIAVCSIIGYLIFINMTQINFGPALLPGGIADSVWYHPVDKDKTELLRNLQPNSKIITNPSNPYIIYFLSVDNPNNISIKEHKNLPKYSRVSAQERLSTVQKLFNSAPYIFIGKTPYPNMDERSFAEFTGYENTTKFFENYVKQTKCPLIANFQDGSQLYSTKCDKKPLSQ